MKFEDENFEEEFIIWLNSKTEEELVESFKKYAINDETYSYKISNEDNLAEEYCFNEIDIETNSYNTIESQQIEVSEISDTISIKENLISEEEGENRIWMKELVLVA